MKVYGTHVCPPMQICQVGQHLITVDDPDKDEVVGAQRTLHFLMNDTVQSGEESGGLIGRLRIYDKALSGSKVLDLKP